jgi:hypothetical protein
LLLHSVQQWHVDGEVFFFLQHSCFVNKLLIFESKTVLGLAWLRLMGATYDVFMMKSEQTQ